MNRLIGRVLENIHPVLVDVGCSDKPPEIWDKIAKHSIYVGFDPDLREIHELPKGRFYKGTIVNEAISLKEDKQVLFYLTKSPYCSSMLRPDSKALSDFLFSDLFTVEKELTVPATTLDSVMERLSLSCVDWLKLDTQGADLGIFKSIKEEVRSKVLAVDIEPGLIDAYIGEDDLFVDVHTHLMHNGFWLSNLNTYGTARMKTSTLRTIMSVDKKINYAAIEKSVKRSPCWVEARYLRTLEWLAQNDFTKRQYILLWIFSLLDNQIGFLLDLAYEYETKFGQDNISQIMKEEPLRYIRRNR